jgi:hypothetical protein
MLAEMRVGNGRLLWIKMQSYDVGPLIYSSGSRQALAFPLITLAALN